MRDASAGAPVSVQEKSGWEHDVVQFLQNHRRAREDDGKDEEGTSRPTKRRRRLLVGVPDRQASLDWLRALNNALAVGIDHGFHKFKAQRVQCDYCCLLRIGLGSGLVLGGLSEWHGGLRLMQATRICNRQARTHLQWSAGEVGGRA